MHPQKEIPFNIKCTYVLQGPKDYLPDKWCIGLLFKNEDQAGQTIAIVNGKQLQPPPPAPAVGEGEWFSFCGNEDEFFRGRVNVWFTDLSGNPSLTGKVSIVERYYMYNEP